MAGLIQKIKLFGSDIPWFETLRGKGLEAFEKQGVPTAKTEAWKYTKPRDLTADDFIINESNFIAELEEFAAAGSEEQCTHDHQCNGRDCHCHHGEDCARGGQQCSCGHEEHANCNSADGQCHCHHEEEIDVRVDLPFEAYQLHFLNGQFIPIYPVLPHGVEIMTLMEAVINQDAKPYLCKLLDVEKHPFAALNTAYMEEGLFIRIAQNTKLEKPLIFINHTSVDNENLFYNLRNLVVVESGAEAELIEWYNYSGAEKSRYFANSVNEIFVNRNAKLKHYKMQDEAFKANHVALNLVRVKENGIYDAFCLQRGANIGRNETKVMLAEEQASAEVNAAYVMHGWATLDTTTDIEHLSPQTFSHQLVKGVVGGDAKGVFQGKIHIAEHAVKTEGFQLHKALLLTDTAEIDVKPELEIFADDVKCSHGAASGELDEETLFYMQSRGIGREDAKQILIDAYLDDVINKISSEPVRVWFKGMVK